MTRVGAITGFVMMSVLLLLVGPTGPAAQQIRSTRVEYSNRPDERAAPGGGSHEACDPGQLLRTFSPDALGDAYPNDGIDFAPMIEVGCVDSLIDAVANAYDGFIDSLVAGNAEFIFSRYGDPPYPGPGSPCDTCPAAALFYDGTGKKGVRYLQRDLNAADADDPLQIDDLDAVELHGPFGTDDARFYSEQGEPGGVSVFRYEGPGSSSSSFLTRAVIAGAVGGLGFVGGDTDVDVDALLVKDFADDGIWGPGDLVVFSIRAAVNWDGGEIVVLPFGGPAAYLQMGGVTWNTALDIGLLMEDDYKIEEVDAVEVDQSRVDPGTDVDLIGVGVDGFGQCDFQFRVTNTSATVALDVFHMEVRDDLTAAGAAASCDAPTGWTCSPCYPHDNAGRSVLRFEADGPGDAVAPGGSVNGFHLIQNVSLSTWTSPDGWPLPARTVLIHSTVDHPDSLGVSCAAGAFGPYAGDGALWSPFGGSAWTCEDVTSTGPGVAAPRASISLLPGVPNPSRGELDIRYVLPRSADVTLRVFDAAGRRVRSLLLSSRQSSGWHSIRWDGLNEEGKPAPAGVYFYRIDVDRESRTRRAVLLR